MALHPGSRRRRGLRFGQLGRTTRRAARDRPGHGAGIGLAIAAHGVEIRSNELEWQPWTLVEANVVGREEADNQHTHTALRTALLEEGAGSIPIWACDYGHAAIMLPMAWLAPNLGTRLYARCRNLVERPAEDRIWLLQAPKATREQKVMMARPARFERLDQWTVDGGQKRRVEISAWREHARAQQDP